MVGPTDSMEGVQCKSEREQSMLVHHLFTAAIGVGPLTLTSARFWAAVAALLGLAGVIIGMRALRRAASGRTGARVAMVAGLVAVIGGAVNLAIADGGPGTGNGVVAGGMAIVLGLLAGVLGGLVVARSRRTG